MRGLKAALVAVPTVLVLLFGTAPAQAKVWTCAYAYACMKNGGQYGTMVWGPSHGPSSSTVCQNIAGDNIIDFGSNSSGRNVKVFDNDTCSGTYSYLYAGTHGGLGSWNDRIESLRWA